MNALQTTRWHFPAQNGTLIAAWTSCGAGRKLSEVTEQKACLLPLLLFLLSCLHQYAGVLRVLLWLPWAAPASPLRVVLWLGLPEDSQKIEVIDKMLGAGVCMHNYKLCFKSSVPARPLDEVRSPQIRRDP